ncbi:MAG TPA: DUF1553 domain-containing protein [Dinghuibacter sp.]|uniref:DUF1553 domain-containing protein n=1 Tax=Dinghuibacter sp. TaxID=2024697 RepID=UPI002CBA527F|nr:DUF1553 domain-containing protein [Dinghuibacter sp.]HTJ10929.1 DUF1553 domain-containing protein [Dinghuibacter sp.]
MRALFITGTLIILFGGACLLRSSTVDFNTEVKPIINRHCITCHGGVRAKGGFSLLFRSDAFARTESGKPAIIPGDPDHSEMIRRLTSKDPEERMPYKHEPLSSDEIDVLRRWVREGAPWGEHWAYVAVAKPTVPEVSGASNIDKYIVSAMHDSGLTPAGEAPRADLLRRVSLDLTGVYPSEAVAASFLRSGDYDALVDTLLASPHFGEKWAAMWLDLARYADTKGYERDDSRNIWRYRDWLIKAFNADMPYDRFLTEQLAGDLLPHPTDDEYIATAFHRNTMTNDEGGTDNEEFRTAAVLDRVNTTWEALMGTTFACTQCHSHPYDPFRHDEYYKFMAYFNDTRDEDSWADYPLLRHLSDSDRVLLDTLCASLSPARASVVRRLVRTWEPSINSLTADRFVNGELNDTKWLAFRQNGSARLHAVDLQDRDWLIYRYQAFLSGGSWEVHLDSLSGRVLVTVPAPVTKDWTIASVPVPLTVGAHDLFLTYHNPLLKNPLQSGIMYDWFCFTQHLPGGPEREAVFWSLLTKPVPTTPIMMDNPEDMHRVSNVFERGNWLVKGDVVTPGVPASLAKCMPAGAPANRLGLAMWMTSKQNPLVSRTMVNRVWEQLFGTGLAETLEDLGTQGSPPTHRALLDYLSWQLMYTDAWSIKKLLREIVLSSTYREDSRVSPSSLAKDPFNRLYSRGARVRLSAEQLRDQDLCISGQLNPSMYGPSVFPYQPKGIWMSPWNGAEWVESKDGEQYRRALYTYWKRTAAYPSMISFDATSREVCTARRIRTNTPLQALVTLNDSAYLDMAGALARRMEAAGASPSLQISAGYRLMLYKDIPPASLAVLLGLYQHASASFKGGDPMTVVANAMLNLDEIITKN